MDLPQPAGCEGAMSSGTFFEGDSVGQEASTLSFMSDAST